MFSARGTVTATGSNNKYFEAELEMSFSDSCSSALAIYDMVFKWKRASAYTTHLDDID